MLDLGRGIKAGIVAGILYAILYVIFQIVVVAIFWQSLGVSTTDMLAVIGFFLPSWIIGGILGGIILGIIFGLIYAAMYSSLPGNDVTKAIILSLIGWAIFHLAIGYGNIAYDPMYYLVGNVVFGLITWLIWAGIFASSWTRFGAPLRAPMQQPMYQQPYYQQQQPQMMYSHQQPPPPMQQAPPPQQQQPPVQQAPPPPQTQPQTQAGAKFCSECGAPIQAGVKFCSGCGKKL